MKNPYLALGINENMKPDMLRNALVGYLSALTKIKNYHGSKQFVTIGTTNRYTNKLEDVLALRYALNLPVNKPFMDEQELELAIGSIEDTRANLVPGTRIKDENVNNVMDLVFASYNYLATHYRKIAAAIEMFDSDDSNPKNPDPIIDAFISAKYTDTVVKIAKNLASELNKNAQDERVPVYSREEFKKRLIESDEYKKATAEYDKIKDAQSRKRNMSELQLVKNMVEEGTLVVKKPAETQELLKREEEFIRQHKEGIMSVQGNIDLAFERGIALNPRKDYGWEMVLYPSKYIFKSEPVDTETFTGRITVENIGEIFEQSLYRKSIREFARPQQQSQEKSKKHRFEFVKSKPKTRGENGKYLVYRPVKTLRDDVLRVTRVDTDGKSTQELVIAPMGHNNRYSNDPRYINFLKNVYFSRPMLEVAKRNGGYIGEINIDKDGDFYVDNRYKHEEIGTAILFQKGSKGKLLDLRKGSNGKAYSEAGIADVFDLLRNKKERNRTDE